MKKFLFLIAAVVLSIGVAQAQRHKVYCELVGQQKLLSTKCTVQVDFGQNQFQNNKLVDENGKKLTFNSMVDAMNFMGELGWEFEQAYIVTIGSGTSAQNVYHWLLSRYLSDEEAIDAGLKTKAAYKAEAKAKAAGQEQQGQEPKPQEE